jgi:pentatricopeptide repeat protein
VVTWSALISGYAQHGLGEEAMACFEQMQSERIIPDAVTFVSVLKACGITGSVRMGEKLHSQIRARGLTPGKEVFLGTALVDMYAKCGALDKAQEAFEELQAPNVVSWNVLISGYAQLGQTEAVSGSFRKMMMDESLHPNAATFVILLTLCTHAGLVKEGNRLFDAMDEKTLDHYVCIIDLYGRAGLFAEAVAMIGRVPQPDRLPLWLVFLAACYRCINLEPGRLAFEHILQLDDRCTSAHVCMANMYASRSM